MKQTTQPGGYTAVFHRWAVPLLVALMALLVATGGEEGARLLRYERTLVQGGQWWRLFTAHLAHLGWSHLLYNLAGLLLVWLLVGRALSAFQWLLLLALDGLAISVGLWLLLPGIDWYVGLSGLLHGMLLAGAACLLWHGDRGQMALLLIVVGKLLWELLLGPLPGSREAAGGEVIVEAHALGAVGGLLFLAGLLLAARLRGD